MKSPADTICALSTAPGRAGLALVRVSGGDALDIYKKIFRRRDKESLPTDRVASLGRIIDPASGTEVDQAVAIHYFGPRSYTGEDMTEYSIHGSPVLAAALLDCICRCGARIADPGEFTMRAFVGGKMDLLQAEAVNDIINAKTRYQAQVAARQQSGAVSREISPIRNLLMEMIVHLESAVEFVDEDISVDSRSKVLAKLSEAKSQLDCWIDSFRTGRIVREGFDLAVIGRPNVGKSSLFNALLQQERSIVLDMPGTTRDLVSEDISIGGIPIRLMDTAGVHGFADQSEHIGAERTFRAIAEADAVLLVIDRSAAPDSADMHFREKLKDLRNIIVFNKIDLDSCWSPEEMEEFAAGTARADVSAKTGRGVEELRSMIMDRAFGVHDYERADVLITNVRHCHGLESARDEMEKAGKAFKEGLSEEFALLHLHKALQHFGAITGETSVQDILGAIFSRFCIGK